MKWWQRAIRRRRLEEQLDKELHFHLDRHTNDLIAEGCDPHEARRRARVELGGLEQVREGCRDARGTRWLDDLSQDFRYALRGLRRRPGFTAVVVCTLALGGGATTIMFTVINSVLLKPLSYPDPLRLVSLEEETDWSTASGNRWAFAYPNYLDCKHETRSLTLAALRFGGGTVSGASHAEYVQGQQISSELLTVLGVPLVHGRAFLEAEDRPGGQPVVIISESLWRRQFGGSPSAIGKPLIFEGKAHTVVGVAAGGFPLTRDSDVFTPIGQDSEPRMRNRNAHPGIRVLARLRPDATLAAAQAELAVIGRRLAQQYPDSNKGRTFVAQPLRPFIGNVGSTLWLLLGAVSLVLLIACANIASLLLARAISRDREMAMRAALGAGRGRLMRQCLTESAVFGFLGGALGVLIATVGVRKFIALWPGGLPRADEVQLDWRVLLFALGVSLASGVLFGLAPALRVPSRGLEQTLRAGAKTLMGGSRRLHGVFVVSEVALAVVLLACAAVLGRTLVRLSSLDPGVNIQNVLVTRMALSPGVMTSPAGIRAAWDDALDRARHVPGVQASAMVDTVPMRQGHNQLGYWTTQPAPPPEQQPIALATTVTPDYLAVMGIPLRSGRFFDERDRMDSQPVVVIDDVMAQHAFGGEDAVGKRLWIQAMGPDPLEVVGVVGHVRHWGLAGDDQSPIRAQFYYPFTQVPDQLVRRWSQLSSIAVRTTVTPLAVVQPLQRELRGQAGDQVLYEVRTLEQLASGTLALQRFLLLLFGIFAGVALMLACIGVYGVLAYLTSQRIPEFGVRMALGASARSVMQLVLRQSLGMIAGGGALGTFAALAAGRVLERLVEGVRDTELSTLAIVIAVLVTAALLASAIPARRASRVDAITALRQE